MNGTTVHSNINAERALQLDDEKGKTVHKDKKNGTTAHDNLKHCKNVTF
jgi:hypothetical protein